MKFILKNNLFTTIKVILTVLAAFFVFEPAVLGANSITVSQTVDAEIAFATAASNITMSPSLNASTGGTASGGTQVVVKTNNGAGYNMTLAADSALGMIGAASSTNAIPAYAPAAAGVPDYSFTVPANQAYFGYTAEASTTADLSTAFKDLAGACNNASGADTADKCWINAGTSPFTIVNRSGATVVSGATTTLKFLVVINSNPSPSIPNDTYVATTTLTATVN